MTPGAVDDVNAPKSMMNIVQEVMQYVSNHVSRSMLQGKHPTDFETYDNALHAVWPELFKADPKAALLVSISIWIDISERWGFKVHPEEIKALRL